jgi:hypothetical protein
MALPSADKVKIWLFPSLISILGLMIWTDLQTIKSSVALNTSTSIVNKTNVENLQRRVDRLEVVIYKQPVIVKNSNNIPEEPVKDNTPLFTKIVAVKPDDPSLLIAKTINKTTL